MLPKYYLCFIFLHNTQTVDHKSYAIVCVCVCVCVCVIHPKVVVALELVKIIFLGREQGKNVKFGNFGLSLCNANT